MTRYEIPDEPPETGWDIHCHTVFSDGTETPQGMVSLALRNGLDGIAITDHDTSAGWDDAADAAARGLEDGDAVEVFNDRGTVRIPAKVTRRIMRGVTCMSQGGWYTPDKNGVDTRGSINVLTGVRPTPLAKGNPQHTNLVEVRKAVE